MATVVFSPGAVTSAANFMQWEDRQPPVGLVDASILSSDSDPRYCQRVRFWRTVRSDKIYINFKRTTPDGGSAFGARDDLTDEWEAYSAALVIRAGGQTWSFAGPTHPQNTNSDATEAYGWRTTTAAVNDFITAYEALTAIEQAGTTITLDDGVVVHTPLDAAGTLNGGLGGSLVGTATLLSPTPLDAAGTLDGGLAGSVSGAASLAALNPLNAAGTLDGGLAGSLAGAASLGLVNPLNAAGTLDGALAGSVSGVASLGPLPLDAVGTLTGGLVGSLAGDAQLYTPPPPPNAMRQFIQRLRLPWDDLPNRWAVTLATADLVQRLADASGVALRELWPATCRPATLQQWGEVLQLPQRDGESAADYRTRLALAATEAVGTSGWVREQVRRITGTERVIEFPREGFVGGYSTLPSRFGAGPVFAIGVAPAQRAELEAVLEPGVESTCGIQYIEPAAFDVIAADPP